MKKTIGELYALLCEHISLKNLYDKYAITVASEMMKKISI